MFQWMLHHTNALPIQMHVLKLFLLFDFYLSVKKLITINCNKNLSMIKFDLVCIIIDEIDIKIKTI